ncbi:MAG: DUF342 domain-containing protein [Chitinivibrionales bacterium]|nr:DUF342 domain-containing protein [Chitinivibrionales bacterium]
MNCWMQVFLLPAERIAVLVFIEDLTPGLRLDEDVKLPNGSVLIPSRSVLTEALISRLKARGIAEISIVDEHNQPPAAESVAVDNTPQTASAPAFPAPQAADPVPAPAEGPAAKTPPRIRVQLDEEKLHAHLFVEPMTGRNEELAREDVHNALTDAKVGFGINELLVGKAVEKWNRFQRAFELEDIAVGTPSQPGKEGALVMKAAFLHDSVDIERATKMSWFWQLAQEQMQADRVDPGDVVAERELGTLPTVGTTVTNEPIPTDEILRINHEFDESVELSADRQQLIAQKSGVPFCDNVRYGVIELNFNGSVDIEVDARKLKAEAVVHKPGPRGAPPARKEIEKKIAEHDIVHGLNRDVLAHLFDLLSHGNYPDEPLTVAQATEPQNGERGTVEFHFNTSTTLKPKTNPDGSVDFKNVDIINSVKSGDELAHLIPPTKGKPGKDLCGAELPCKDGVDVPLPAGPNTEAHPEKPEVLIAGADGIVKYNGSVVEVSEGYVVNGDVDFSTGNVNYKKSVSIKGDVKSGFEVECGGDLEVGGTIEDAKIIVGGNLLCKHGFIGQGSGSIDAQGDVNITFAKNQLIRSKKAVVIAREALNCTIYSRDFIEIHGNPLSVAGGLLVARNHIEVHAVGNVTNIKTTLEIGLDFALVDELHKTEDQMKEIKENSRKLLEPIHKFERFLKIKKKLPPKDDFLYKKLKTTHTKYSEQLKALEMRKSMINAKLYDIHHAYIIIKHSAMPGTTFKIADRFLQVDEEIIGPKTIKLVKDQIRII